MHRATLIVCSHCLPNFWRPAKLVSARFLHNTSSRQRQTNSRSRSYKKTARLQSNDDVPLFRPSRQQPSIDSRTIIYQRLKDYVGQWSNDRTIRRLESYGVPRNECGELLSTFQKCSRSGSLPSVDKYDTQTLTDLSDGLSDLKQGTAIERSITRIFIDWVLMPQFRSLYDVLVSEVSLNQLRTIRSITDFPYPPEFFPLARSIKRKIIMHVGPTNSGKTHHALRALAAARTGVYAGPLRLLAHEIWERLNRGQIVPLGMELDKDAEADDNGGADILDGSSKAAPVVTKGSNPAYVRACNLITGEEQRTVALGALLSCTVEMLPYGHIFDVAVVDEIQMIADPGRGSGWTSAVLGLCAKEVHLCGEETAVPIIKKLVEQTGDDLVVNYHKRLTPLQVAKKSLDSDYSNIRKGDCVVSFSRSGIYTVKAEIERLTGLRCAVAYGRLPPEIRSEQAALFNDPSSGYDVMVGSDALGMGLNLKIKRIVFSAVRKWDGKREHLLSTSQIKQIAGRAGRYGLHEDPNAAGIATTFHPQDLPILKEALSTPLSPLTHAALPHDSEALVRLFRVFPTDCNSLSTIVDNFEHLCRVPPPFKLTQDNNYSYAVTNLDPYYKDLSIEDLNVWYLAPIQWRDEGVADVARRFLRDFRDKMAVSLTQVLEATGLAVVLREVLQVISWQTSREVKSRRLILKDPKNQMASLETLHRAVVLYQWMSIRRPVIFFESPQAVQLKEQSEKAMDFVLQVLTRKQGSPFGGSMSRQAISYKGRWQLRWEKANRKAEWNAKREAAASSI